MNIFQIKYFSTYRVEIKILEVNLDTTHDLDLFWSFYTSCPHTLWSQKLSSFLKIMEDLKDFVYVGYTR